MISKRTGEGLESSRGVNKRLLSCHACTMLVDIWFAPDLTVPWKRKKLFGFLVRVVGPTIEDSSDIYLANNMRRADLDEPCCGRALDSDEKSHCLRAKLPR